MKANYRTAWPHVPVPLFAILALAALASFLLDNAVVAAMPHLRSFALTASFLSLSNVLVVGIAFIIIPALALLRMRHWRGFAVLLATAAFAAAFTLALKLIIARSRPAGALLHYTGISVYSMPSEHTLLCFALLPVLAWLFFRLRWLILAGALLEATSRIYLGVHYLSDVAVGAILGLGIGVLIVRFYLASPAPARRSLSSFELRRKALHILLGVAIAALLPLGAFLSWALIALLLCGIIASIIERRHRIAVLSPLLDAFERREARSRLPGEGLLFYLAGALIAAALFPTPVAQAAVIILAIGDSVSHLAGMSIGRTRHPFDPQKLLEGWLIGLLAAFAAATLFVPAREAAVGALAGMLVEAANVPLVQRRISDNVLIPAAAGVAMLLFRLLV